MLIILAFVAQILIQFRWKSKKLFAVMIPAILIQWFFYQCYCSLQWNKLSGAHVYELVAKVTSLPIYLLFGIQLFFSLVCFGTISSILHWNRKNVTNNAIKEGIDEMSTGICWYYSDGFIKLANREIDRLCFKLTGKQLRNGKHFEGVVRLKDFSEQIHSSEIMMEEEENQTGNLEKETFSIENFLVNADDEVWEISIRKSHERSIPNEMTAKNITTEYGMTKSLLEKQEELRSLNKKLDSYYQEIMNTVTSEEILNAKARIHDELGIALLSAKQYLLEEEKTGQETARKEVINLLNKNIDFLQNDSSDVEKTDEYDLMFRTAEQVLVQVHVSGNLPKSEPAKHIVAMAMHECITNTIRHADGDEIWICVEENDGDYFTSVSFTNNGKQPGNEVIPKGGLLSIQEMTEQAGGRMEITSMPKFILKLLLPQRVK